MPATSNCSTPGLNSGFGERRGDAFIVEAGGCYERRDHGPGTMRRIVIGVAVLLGLLILLPLAAFYMVDPNWLKPQIEAMASKSLGRKVELRGPLELKRGWTLQIAAHDVHLANVPGGEAGEMMAADTVRASIDLWQLVTHGRVALPEVAVSGADLHLERNADGHGNWELGAVQQLKPERRTTIPFIGHATIRDSKIAFKDQKSG
jgi:uncharacterized protein involved in outer membrane biogenesis